MLDDDFQCPHGCDANGFLFDEVTRAAYPCSCRTERLRRRVQGGMEASVGRYAPSRFQDLDWSCLPLSGIAERHTHMTSLVRRYAANVSQNVRQGRGMGLVGNKGTGKTTLAYFVAQEARAAGLSVLTRNTTDLLNEIRDSYRADAQPTTRQIIDAVTFVDLLHLEDLSVPRPNDWVLEQLYTIVNRRYEHNRAILFTSDMPFGEPILPDTLAASLVTAVGERTYSRLRQMIEEPLVLQGEDFRLAG